MSKYLFILGSFYPNPSANGVCIQNICDSISKENNDIYILSENNKSIEETIKFKDYNINLIKQRNINRIDNRRKTVTKMNSILHFKTWPITSYKVTNNFYRRSVYLIEKFDINNVICVCNPFETIYVGNKLKEKFPEIKLTYYFLDAFFNGRKPSWMTTGTYENRLLVHAYSSFQNANNIIFMKNHKIPENIMIEFKNKIHFLDIPLFNQSLWKNNTTKERIPVFLYVGNFVSGLREPDYLFEILWGLYSNGFKFKAYFYGNLIDEPLPKYAKNLINENVVFIRAQIDHEEALVKMMDADILINVDSTNRNFIPSKLFEYISTGNTILNISEGNNDISMIYLEKYERYVSFNKSKDVDFKVLINEIEKKISGENNINLEIIKSKFETNTPETLINLI